MSGFTAGESEDFRLNQLIINALTREKRVVLVKDGKIDRLSISQPQQLSNIGNIYWGTVVKVLPGMNAAFVDIGNGMSGYLHRNKLPGYLQHDKSISHYLHQGEKIMVQIEKDATGIKKPRLSAIIELSGEYLIYMPSGRYVAVSKKMTDTEQRDFWRKTGQEWKKEEEGLIFRTACEAANTAEIEAELGELRLQYEVLKKKAIHAAKPQTIYQHDHFLASITELIKKQRIDEIIIDEKNYYQRLKKKFPEAKLLFYQEKNPLFSEYHLEHELEKVCKRIVWLKNGAYLVFDEAEALTVIDVNTGKYSGKRQLADTVRKTNKMAALEAARQIRLRDLAGMILIDFIDMEEERDRRYISSVFQQALQEDDRQKKIIGFTPLGILQLTRKKTKVSILETTTDICPTCAGTGHVKSAETAAFQLERELFQYRGSDAEKIHIQATEDVINAFCGADNFFKKDFEAYLGIKLVFFPYASPKPAYLIGRVI
ncbi:Rne/Rng family ribonuclease [Bacillaceae bacterium Marseille-Q3522]|nr:Rne/Rng family ribonuclease [Bacillaceae bacterium Marseille-Q3522]